MPTKVEANVAISVGTNISKGRVLPAAARTPMTPSGSSATLEVLMARNRHMALVATPGNGLSRFNSVIALMPNGVAALPRPSMFAEMLRIMALMAGCSAGTSGNRRTITGRTRRASWRIMPPASRMRTKPSHNAMMPIKPMASVTAPLAAAMLASAVSCMRPDRPANRMAPMTKMTKTTLMGLIFGSLEGTGLCPPGDLVDERLLTFPAAHVVDDDVNQARLVA